MSGAFLGMVAGLIMLAIPFAALFDIAAFIDYLAKRKAAPEKRRRAEKNFIIASVCLTVGISVIALLILVMRIIY